MNLSLWTVEDTLQLNAELANEPDYIENARKQNSETYQRIYSDITGEDLPEADEKELKGFAKALASLLPGLFGNADK